MSDEAMIKFVTDWVIDPNPKFSAVSNAFTASYEQEKENMFTKLKFRECRFSTSKLFFTEYWGN